MARPRFLTMPSVLSLRRRGVSAQPDVTAVAETVLRLAVLLEAGISPQNAWNHLARLGEPSAASISAQVRDGGTVASALAGLGADGATWAEVGAAWSLATTVGAPLAPTLRAFASTLRDAGEASDEIRVALAEPTATARLMGWLPAVGIALAMLLGFDPIGVLLREPLGWACAALGVGLLIAARRWTIRLAAAAQASGRMPGLDADLIAIALSGGVSISRARALADDVTDGRITRDPPAALTETLALSESAGVPAVDLLRASAAMERHRARVDGRLRAATLSSRLLLPLGVCTLPAFLCLGVAPMFLSILPSVGLPTGEGIF